MLTEFASTNKKFCEELIAYFPLIQHGQQFFYCCVCIRCRGNDFTEPFPSNGTGIHTYKLMRGIYEVRRCDGLRCNDIPSFIQISSGIQNLLVREGDSQTHGQHDDLISIILCFQNKESRLQKFDFVYILTCELYYIASSTEGCYCLEEEYVNYRYLKTKFKTLAGSNIGQISEI
jgi:hypothetical protein